MAELSKAIARLMEEQRRVQVPAPPDPPQVREVVEDTRSQVAPGERTLAEHFVRLFVASAGPTDMPEKELSALAMVAFRFLMEVAPEEPRVRVFSPDIAHEGWESSGSVIQLLMRARPFIVDTVRACLDESDCTVRQVIAPTFKIERDPRRAVLTVDEPGVIGPRETFVHIEIERHPEPQVIAQLVRQRLGDLILANEDEGSMRARLEGIIDELRASSLAQPWGGEAAEAAAFLEWLGDGRFTFLGYREYELSGQGLDRLAHVRPGSGLGILQNEDLSRYVEATPLSDALRQRLHEPPLLMLSKTNAQSTVRRRSFMDYVGIKQIDGSGVVVGERRFLGLFTDEALAEKPSEIPLLRGKLAIAMESEGAGESTPEGQEFVGAFDALPRVEPLAMHPKRLGGHLRRVLAARQSTVANVDYVPDALDRGVFVLVTMPRERFAREMFERTEQRLVQASGASAVLDRTLVVDEKSARMHFYLAANAEMLSSFRLDELKAPVLELLRTWEDRLRDELHADYTAQQIQELLDRYSAALPASYKANRDIRTTATDIQHLEQVRATRKPIIELIDDPTAPGRFGRLELFHAHGDFIVGDFVRSLGRLGLGVHDVDVTSLDLAGKDNLEILSFRVRDERGPLDIERTAALVLPALARLEAGTMADDALNALIARAGLGWRQVDVLRACTEFAVQSGAVAARESAHGALIRHPHSAQLLWEYFSAKFDPLDESPARDRETRALPDLARRFEDSLRSGQTAPELRILRALFRIVSATARTNYFLASVSGSALDNPSHSAPPIAIKLYPRDVVELRDRQPLIETFVDGVHVQGTYQRDGVLARGGIAILPSADGLRSNVLRRLDLQTPRTATIAPDAAYGALTAKRADGDTNKTRAAYRDFLAAILDITDNVEDGHTKTPPGVVAYDGADEYLVAGPGPGSAGFLDVGNELASQRNYWLGSAFASFSSADDRKSAAEATARGAWESVRRHFTELDRNADREDVTVVGIGNLATPELAHALLLSRRILLRAAFDGRNIFLDPAPNASRAFAERERLFCDPNRTWDDYDRDTLSEGGAIHPRGGTAIQLHPDTRAMLDLEGETFSGDDIVRAILTMDTDVMLSAGGGTFVKSRDERHADASDPQHDRVRIDGEQLNATVVAELRDGVFTQKGRIAYALRGGRINTAATDLAAEIQLRDRQVNVEIAIAPNAEGPTLTRAERPPLVADARARNAEVTLSRCRDRVRALGLDRERSVRRLDDFADAIRLLEVDGLPNREQHSLPQKEALRARRSSYLGLTHPEISVLEALSKVTLRRQLAESNLPDDAFFERYLRAYFPAQVEARCGQGIRSHRLRRQLIAAELSNAAIDSMGAAFVARLRRETGMGPADIVRAWAVAVAVSRADALWHTIADTAPALPLDGEAHCWNLVADSVERVTRWLLRTQPTDAAASVLVDTFELPVAEVRSKLGANLPEAIAANRDTQIDEIAAHGVPRVIAEGIAELSRAVETLDIASIALERNLDIDYVCAGYYRVCDLLDLEWLERRLTTVVATDRWERLILLSLNDDLLTLRRDFSTNVLTDNPEAVDAEAAVASYLMGHQGPLAHIGGLIDDITTSPRVTLAALSVVIRELGQLAKLEY